MTKPPVTLEVCLESPESAIAARAGGAGRIELCSWMDAGGVTPSAGLIRAVRRVVGIPLFVLIRPRPGDFVYSAAELRTMDDDIRAARDLGADGVVIGALTARGTVDRRAVERLLRAAGPMGTTFHRAFDDVAGRAAALGVLADLGVERVLTSGGAPTAFAGRKEIARLVRLAAGRIVVMAGGGVGLRTAARLVGESGVREVHSGSAVATDRPEGRGAYRVPVGRVSAAKVRALVRRLGERS